MSKSPIRRAPGGKFAPGSSGNPGGRPRTPVEVKELLSSVTGEAVERLVSIMRSKDPQQARLAAEALLDRSLGRPQQNGAIELRRGPDAAVVAGQPDVARRKIEEMIAAATATGAAGIAASADLPAMIGSSDQASDRQSVGAGEGSPSENDDTDDAERALQTRYDANGRGED